MLRHATVKRLIGVFQIRDVLSFAFRHVFPSGCSTRVAYGKYVTTPLPSNACSSVNSKTFVNRISHQRVLAGLALGSSCRYSSDS